MDIEEIKKYAINKIEAGELTKQVRQRIKETTWEKQNMREGFTETFKPLISKFEKPEDSKTKNIFTQNQEMLRNQLALTEGLRDNQRALTEGLKDNQQAITQGFSQLKKLADKQEFPGVEIEDEDKDDQAQAPFPKEAKSPFLVDEPPITQFDVKEFDRNLNNKESQDVPENNGYNYLASYYFNKNISEIYSLINSVNSHLKDAKKDIHNTAENYYNNGYELARPKNENPRAKTINNIKNFNTLSIYSTNLNLLRLYKEKSGSGMFYSNPQELLKRFELLNGSLAAGNNGVLPEFIQIAHRLRDLGIITSNQLSKLLRRVI